MPQAQRDGQRRTRAPVVVDKPRATEQVILQFLIALVDRELLGEIRGRIRQRQPVLIKAGESVTAVEIAGAQIVVIVVLNLHAAFDRVLGAFAGVGHIVLILQAGLLGVARTAGRAAAAERAQHVDRYTSRVRRLIPGVVLILQARFVQQFRTNHQIGRAHV